MPLLKVVVANCRESNVASLHNSIETVATLEKDISCLVHPSTSYLQSKEDDPELVGEQHQGDELSHQVVDCFYNNISLLSYNNFCFSYLYRRRIQVHLYCQLLAHSQRRDLFLLKIFAGILLFCL